MHNKPLTIGIVLKAYPRLSETFIINEIYLLERLGFRLHIFAMRNPGDAADPGRVSEIKAQVSYIPDHPWRHFPSFAAANVAQSVRRPGVYWRAIRFAVRQSLRERSSSAIKRFFQAAFLVQRTLPGSGVGYFHAHFSHDPTTVAFFASWLTGISYSFSAHAKDIYVEDSRFLRHKLEHACFVVTCTEFNRIYLQKLTGQDKKVLRSYHGIDLSAFRSRPPAKGNGRTHILSVGRLVPKKGFPILLKALYVLRLKGYDFLCTIIGDGPVRSDLDRLIAEYQLVDHVSVLASMPQNALFEHYENADLFALPCEVQQNGDRDGIPNVIVEAIAIGVPVVSTRISGIPECIQDGVNGILVSEGSAADLSNAIARLIDEQGLGDSLARAGRKTIEQHFDATRNIERIAAALRSAAAHNGGEGPHSGGAPGHSTDTKILTDYRA